MTTEVTNTNMDLAKRVSEAAPLHVVFIFDRSGSMAGHEEDVIGGFNTYIEGLKKESGEVGVSYVRFDTGSIEKVWVDLPLDQVPTMTKAHYQPRGGTPLLDAVGSTVSTITDIPEHSFIVITHTDGYENSSVEWTKEKVQALVKEREALGNWTFLFFGQGFDQWNAEMVSGSMNMAASNTVSYAHGTGISTMSYSSRVSNVMRAARLSSTQFYSNAMDAAAKGMSNKEIERILRGEKDGE